jgi:hypothetical protein
LYSGGINLRGNLWGRPFDTIGIGHALLEGGNTGIDQSDVSEAYWRIGFNESLAVNLDLQHLRDTYDPGAGDRVQGWVSSVMLSSTF